MFFRPAIRGCSRFRMAVVACSGNEQTLIDYVHVANRGLIHVVEHSGVTDEPGQRMGLVQFDGQDCTR